MAPWLDSHRPKYKQVIAVIFEKGPHTLVHNALLRNLKNNRNEWKDRALKAEHQVAELEGMKHISAQLIRMSEIMIGRLVQRVERAEPLVRELERRLDATAELADAETSRRCSAEARIREFTPPDGHINVPLPHDCVQEWADCEDHHRPHMTVLFDACRKKALEAEADPE